MCRRTATRRWITACSTRGCRRTCRSLLAGDHGDPCHERRFVARASSPLQQQGINMLERIEHESGICELKLNRPPVNALNPGLVHALREAVEAAPRDEAQALVISGSSGIFSAGLDVP